jgi:lysozyme family protein
MQADFRFVFKGELEMLPRLPGDKSDTYYNNLISAFQDLDNKKPFIVNQYIKLAANYERYMDVETATGVPWQVVGVLHMRESDFNFNCNLCNGEPLDQVTKLVPKGLGPWATWGDSAVDAIKYENVLSPEKWDLPSTFRYIEGFNGFGYMNIGVHSPYLWSFSNIGVGVGKYISDGHYDPHAVDDQCGCATMLIHMGFQGAFEKPVFVFSEDDTPKSENVDLQLLINNTISKKQLSYNKLQIDGVLGDQTNAMMVKMFGFKLFGSN